ARQLGWLEPLPLALAGDVPEDNGPVVARRGQQAAGPREGDRRDLVAVSLQLAADLAGRCVQQPPRGVGAEEVAAVPEAWGIHRRQQFAVGREDDLGAAPALERMDLLP